MWPLLVAVVLALTSCSDDTPDAATPTPTAPPSTSGGGTEGATGDSGPGDTTGTSAAPVSGCPSPQQVVISAEGDELQVADGRGGAAPIALTLDALAPADRARLVDVLAAGRRTVRVTVPDGDAPHPVLLEFHGYTSNAAQQTWFSGLSQLGAEAGYLVVAIDGREPHARRWEVTAVDPEPAAMEASDVAVVDAVLDVVLPSFCGNPDQVHAAGMSNGSLFSAVYACHSRHRIRAVGSVAFTTGLAGCDAERQVPTVAFHGTDDLIVPIAGRGLPGIRAVLGWELEPAEEAMAVKAQLNGCDGFDDERIGDDVVRRQWRGCEAETVFYLIEGGAHGWPGSDAPVSSHLSSTETIDASALIVEFFDRN